MIMNILILREFYPIENDMLKIIPDFLYYTYELQQIKFIYN
jgi:hypothetical protein